MATQFSRFMDLPRELRDMIWQHSMISGPGVQFVKADEFYNGTFLEPALSIAYEQGQVEYDPGVEDISSLSAACEHARLAMVSTEAKEAVEQMIRKRGMARLIAMMGVTWDPCEREFDPIDMSEWPRIIMDKVNDIVVFSTFHSDHFPDENFSGGMVREHPELYDSKIVGISYPQFDRAADDMECRDCANYELHEPHRLVLRDRLEFCQECMASWTADLDYVELVYLIVPGVRRARAGDEVEVYRFGESSVISAAFDSMPEEPHQRRDLGPTDLPALGSRVAMTIVGTQTTEALGPDGPRCFNGCGITLFEVPKDEVPEMAHEVMTFMFDGFYKMRCDFTRDHLRNRLTYPCPRNPRHCGGAIEFRFLSYQAS